MQNFILKEMHIYLTVCKSVLLAMILIVGEYNI